MDDEKPKTEWIPVAPFTDLTGKIHHRKVRVDNPISHEERERERREETPKWRRWLGL